MPQLNYTRIANGPDIPSTVKAVLQRAPNNGILPWLEEIDRAVNEISSESGQNDDSLMFRMMFQVISLHEERKYGDAPEEFYLSLAGTSQVALSFFLQRE